MQSMMTEYYNTHTFYWMRAVGHQPLKKIQIVQDPLLALREQKCSIPRLALVKFCILVPETFEPFS